MRPSPILQAVAQLSGYLLWLLAIWIFWRGHNAPGGGFIAGLLVSAAMVLQGLAFGSRVADAILPVRFSSLIAAGLALILVTGFGGLFVGRPFLTHTFGRLHLPLLGDVELATAAIFDLGVMLAVVGSVKAVILTIDRDRPGQSA